MTSTSNFSSKSPSIGVYGCGGCGINIVDLLKKYDEFSNIDMVKFDTSTANVTSAKDVNILASGKGSGKLRLTNAKELKTELSDIEKYIPKIPEIAIIASSVSGGSGNVCLTALLSEFANRNAQPVLFLVADTTSEIDNINTLYAIDSILQSAIVNDIYVPIIIYHNNDNNRNITDVKLMKDLYVFLRMLTVNTYEVDCNDRLNWLNAKKTINAESGVVTMEIYSEYHPDKDSGIFAKNFEDTETYDSVLSLGLSENNEFRGITKVGRSSRFFKEGINISEDFQYPMIGCITPSNKELYRIRGICQSNINKYDKLKKEYNSSKRKITINQDDPNILI